VIAYFDASALVKRYIEETGSAQVRDALAGARAATARFSVVEITSAIARRAREGTLDPALRDSLCERVAEDAAHLLLVELDEIVAERSRVLLLRHPLRAGDALQLASCLTLAGRLGRPLRFVCFDGRLNSAASAEGLTVLA